MKREHSGQILENIEIPNFLKMRPVSVGRTKRYDEAIVAFHSFAKTLKLW
jgi:hypothetical protein